MRYRGGWAGYAARSLVRAQNRTKHHSSSGFNYNLQDSNGSNNSVLGTIISIIYAILVLGLIGFGLFAFIWLIAKCGIFGFGIGIYIFALIYFLLGG